MRLGQLSRQIGVSQKEIAAFIKKEKGIELKLHPNVKVDDEITPQVIEHFAQPTTQSTEGDVVNKTKQPLPTPQTESELVTETPVSEPIVTQTEKEDIAIDEPIEKIKTVIPQLEGIKVVGKIDLPEVISTELKATETDSENQEESATEEPIAPLSPNATPMFKRKPKRKKNVKKPTKPKQKTETEEEKRIKEIAQVEAMREERKKKLRAANKEKHLSQVKSYQKPKPKKKTNKKEQPTPKVIQKQAPKPKTLLGKIWRWMNTE